MPFFLIDSSSGFGRQPTMLRTVVIFFTCQTYITLFSKADVLLVDNQPMYDNNDFRSDITGSHTGEPLKNIDDETIAQTEDKLIHQALDVCQMVHGMLDNINTDTNFAYDYLEDYPDYIIQDKSKESDYNKKDRIHGGFLQPQIEKKRSSGYTKFTKSELTTFLQRLMRERLIDQNNLKFSETPNNILNLDLFMELMKSAQNHQNDVKSNNK